MIGRNLSVLLTLRKLTTDLFCLAKNLHFSCRQYLHNNSLSMASVKLIAYTSYESVKKNEGNQNAEQPIIIMHCLFGSKSNWNALPKTIHQKTKRKVIVVDARNHGDSPHTSNMSYEDI
ncbi:probable alcohol acetyltransferase, partial [Formica exsecta]|uniref:probable alcohol acetyltransferase n=1 Tax=Formica exsecta TaxID=72781 RepID=UPI0011432100